MPYHPAAERSGRSKQGHSNLGAEISEGNGSRVRIALKGVRAVFHRPHPRKETNIGAVKSVRRFLEAAGVKP